jgi:hypothetical protein
VLGVREKSKKKLKKEKEKAMIKIREEAINDGESEKGEMSEEETKEIDELIGLRMRSQLFAYVMSKTMSSSFTSNINLSMKDSNFSVRRSKKATARVVVWNECEVMNSVTIEASFCGGGNNQKEKATKKSIVNAWKAGDLGYLSTTEETNNIIADEDNQEHETIPVHYSMEDLQAMGEIICRAVQGYLAEDSKLKTMPRSMTPPLVVEDSFAHKLTSILKLKELRKRELMKHRARIKLGLKSTMKIPNDNSTDADTTLEDFMMSDYELGASDRDPDGSDSNPSADEMDDDELQATGTFTHFITRVEKIHFKTKTKSNKKKKKTKIKGILASRKSRPSNDSKKKNKQSESNQPPRQKIPQVMLDRTV